MTMQLPIKEDPGHIDLAVTFSIHCLTEDFDPQRHMEHHRYNHEGERRAFDPTRYECSLQLPTEPHPYSRRLFGLSQAVTAAA